jgi:SH3 domain protein
MNRPLLKQVCLIVLLVMLATPAKAQTNYVTDDFEIMFRAGPRVQNKIIRPLRSGTLLEVLDDDAGNGHSQVKTSRGEIGYVLTRFISDSVPAKNQLGRMEERLASLTADPGDLRAELADAQESNELLIAENVSLATRLKIAQDRIEEITNISGDSIQLTEEAERLNNEVQQLLLQVDDFRIQTETLRDTADNKTRLVTTGTILVGIFLGWILSLAGGRRRNRSNW